MNKCVTCGNTIGCPTCGEKYIKAAMSDKQVEQEMENYLKVLFSTGEGKKVIESYLKQYNKT